MTQRETQETDIKQGEDESLVYTITTTPWGSSPTGIAVKGYEIAQNGQRTDVTSTIMPTGSASAAGDVITLPAITALTAGKNYRIEVKFTSGSNTFEPYFMIEAEH